MFNQIFQKLLLAVFTTTPLIFRKTAQRPYTQHYPQPTHKWKPSPRDKTLNRLRTNFYDILIIGGGSAGVGVALDGASRGFSVALIEQQDFSSGTSSKSSKLLHGGVRYLEKAWNQISLKQLFFVKQALNERNIVMQMIPHLSKSVEFMIPIYNRWLIPYYYLGMKLYDFMSGTNTPSSILNTTSEGNVIDTTNSTKYLNRKSTLYRFPYINPNKLIGSIIYKDGFFLDFRANVMLMMTAAFYGADVANYIELLEFEYENGQVSTAIVHDKIKNQTFSIKAKAYISTTGPFTNQTLRIANEKHRILKTSSGSHIVLDNKLGPIGCGFVDPKTDDKRVLFFVPFKDKIICGSTDNFSKPTLNPSSNKKDIRFLLNEVRKYLKKGIKITKKDILSTWNGIRPLVFDRNKKSGDLLRSHSVKQTDSGLVVLSGGKWTTFRQMAEDTIDFVIEKFNFPRKKCVTKDIKCIGANATNTNLYKEVSKRARLSEDLTEKLHEMNGDRIISIEKYFIGEPTFINKKYNLTKEEVEYQIENEFAMKPGDILLRRTGIAFFDVKEAESCVFDLMKIFSKKFGYDSKTYKKEKEEVLQELNCTGLWIHKDPKK
ncbi:putative glycerol-3-phosphate dehydrogenase [Cucumispora dikerogammari]|nr:putative glycerol-3-phosphate dehydrogenase [Cucumispora dikerogammari]